MTYLEWRAMWDRSGPWRPSVDDITIVLNELDRLRDTVDRYAANTPVPEDVS